MAGIDFCLLDFDTHRTMHTFTKAINHFYLDNSELYTEDFSWTGFDWLVPDDNIQNILVFRRMDGKGNEMIFAVNFSTVDRHNYEFGVDGKRYEEVFSTDWKEFGGNDIRNGEVKAKKEKYKGKEYKLTITIPAMSGIFLKKKSKEVRLD